jgi:hypothetical protein
MGVVGGWTLSQNELGINEELLPPPFLLFVDDLEVGESMF